MTVTTTVLQETTSPHLDIDGSLPLTTETVAALEAFCDTCEDAGPGAVGIVRLSGRPGSDTFAGTTVHLVNKWERALRRVERMGAVTVAVVEDECGGPALEALLATDYRVATPGSLLVPVGGPKTTWPGMSLYRFFHQAGAGAARRYALLGLPVQVEQARELGLVDEVDARAEEVAAQVAQTLRSRSSREFAVRRQLLAEASATTFDEALGRHLAACDRELRRGVDGAVDA
ncbi:enoyl-CoA-hydratase DpgB [Nocardiopsis sp. NPDC058631]|uniref:enoyl-CoA-hydratase DpgB n=1 Tax=Nocardiopsis sp. NPDC058631 TaxID=3346566 RepID=UPI00365BF051